MAPPQTGDGTEQGDEQAAQQGLGIPGLSQQEQMELAQMAMSGDSDAAGMILAKAAPAVRARYEELVAELESRQDGEWDRDAARAEVMPQAGGATHPDEAWPTGAIEEVMGKLLEVLALTPMTMLAPEHRQRQMGQRWNQAVLELLLLCHNPTIQYGLLAAVRPELRDDFETFFDRLGTEVWGALDALTQADEVSLEDFPPETQAVLRNLIESVEADLDARQRGEG